MENTIIHVSSWMHFGGLQGQDRWNELQKPLIFFK